MVSHPLKSIAKKRKNKSQFNSFIRKLLKAREEANASASFGEPRKFDIEIMDANRTVKDITGGMLPQEFM